MLAITCYRNGIVRGEIDTFSWHKGEPSPFQACGLNVLKTYDRIEVDAMGLELDLLIECLPNLLTRNTPMTASYSITFFGEQALFIVYNFPYEHYEK